MTKKQPQTRWHIQLMEEFGTIVDANDAFAALRLQDGFEGGRVLVPDPSNNSWRVQAFFQDEPEAAGWLPDGMRRVLVLASSRALLGLS